MNFMFYCIKADEIFIIMVHFHYAILPMVEKKFVVTKSSNNLPDDYDPVPPDLFLSMFPMELCAPNRTYRAFTAALILLKISLVSFMRL